MAERKYIEVTDKEREILLKKVDYWIKNGPNGSKFFANIALVKNAIMEYIANEHGKTIYEPPIEF